jgi:hypothetical protein
VCGSALVQVSVPACGQRRATVHPTDPTDEKNYTIMAKSGLGMAVVDGRKVPESLIVSWYNRGIRVLSRSDEDTRLVFDEQGGVREVPNTVKGKPVLTNKMAVNLAVVAKSNQAVRNDKLDMSRGSSATSCTSCKTRPLVGQ